MAEETKIESVVSEQKTRRSAIKTAAQVAVTAPAVGILLNAATPTKAAAYVRWASHDNGGTAPYTTADDVQDTGLGGVDNAVLIGDDLYTF